jgi:hypothetical protein
MAVPGHPRRTAFSLLHQEEQQPSRSSPLKEEEPPSRSSPFKGEGRRGMGFSTPLYMDTAAELRYFTAERLTKENR